MFASVTANDRYVLRRVFFIVPTFSAVSEPIYFRNCHTTCCFIDSESIAIQIFKVPLKEIGGQIQTSFLILWQNFFRTLHHNFAMSFRSAKQFNN